MQFRTFLADIINTSNIPQATADQAHLDAMLNIVFSIAGSAALLMMVIGGLRYITAQGDASGVSQAKKTIIYAIVGLIITMMAYAIVKFVIIGVTS